MTQGLTSTVDPACQQRPWALHLGPHSARVSLLFAMVTEAVARSGWALLSEDPDMGQGVVDGDQAIDELTAEIELAVWDQLRQAPADGDHLQQAVGLLLILPELERSADLAEHIAQRSLTGLGPAMTPVSRGIIQRMSEVAIHMWNRAAKAYTERNVHFGELDEADEELDVLHERLSNEVAAGGMDAAVAAQVTLLSRFYERLGDHAVNLARRIDQLPH
jgi:phosphate transport system protein